jgi:SAM-dependent methyltransferase
MSRDPVGGAPGRAPWWVDYFDETFLRLYRPFLPPERAAREVEAIIEILGPAPGSRFIDLACGWGRHSIELARRGLKVCGVDRSGELLRHARDDARRRDLRLGWVCADVRELPHRHSFDFAISLFSSFGYFLSDREDLRALRAARDALRAGGTLLIETMHRDDIVRRFLPRDWWEGEAGELVWVDREFDALAGVSHEVLRWRMPDGHEGEKRHSIRIRSATEWGELLGLAGLAPLEWYGSWNRKPFSHRSPRLIVTARAS